jgi:uncharacterized protein YutE (UPF0331/DUF86 family)
MPKDKVPLNKEVLRMRISYVEDSLKSLERFKGIPFKEFHSNPDNFRIVFYDLHRALEAIMDIGSHILSRIPGARPSSYEDITRLLERHKMAGYRNRMVHFYGEITEQEIYNIIQEELQDFYAFCSYINEIVRAPETFGLAAE